MNGLLEILSEIALPLAKNKLIAIAKKVLLPLGLTITYSVNIERSFGLKTTTLVIPNEILADIIRIVKSFEYWDVIIENEKTEQRIGFFVVYYEIYKQ